MWQFLVVISVADHVGDVNHAEQGKYERLQNADERSQEIENHGDDDLGKASKDFDGHMVPSHIAKKSHAKRKRTNSVADNFQRNHKGCKEEQRANKMFEIGEPLFFESEEIVRKK